MRTRYFCSFIACLLIEVVIGKYATGIVRGYLGDILVIPTLYFLFRFTFFAKNNIFSVYVLPILCYYMGWGAEIFQAIDITGKLGIDKRSFVGIVLGGFFDINDIMAYLLGLFVIGLYLAVETRWTDDRQWWYPIGVFIHLTWGILQTCVGFYIYLRFIKCPHRYYRGVIQTVWPANSGLSMGLFIFTPSEECNEEDKTGRLEYCNKVSVHEYGHTFQALLLGPLYPIIIGIPSIAWGSIPKFQQIREKYKLRYTWLFCEKWASYWGEKVTGEDAIWD